MSGMTATDPFEPLRAVRLTTEADVLAFIPYTLGFHPHDSLVVVGIGSRGGPMVARSDLRVEQAALRAYAEEVSSAAAGSGIGHAILVAYTDDVGPALLAVDEMADALAARDVPVVHAFRAEPDRFFPLSPAEPGWGVGTAYDVSTHALTAHAVAEGRVTYADRAQLEASLDPADLDLVDAVGDALAEPASADLADRAVLRAEADWAAAWVGDRLARPVEVPRWPAADEVARLLRVVAVADAREVVWARITRDTATAHTHLWRTVARMAPDGHRAPAWALLAFAAWLEGNGALAWCAVDRARADDPDLGLTAVVAAALEDAVPPSTWTPIDPATIRLLSA